MGAGFIKLDPLILITKIERAAENFSVDMMAHYRTVSFYKFIVQPAGEFICLGSDAFRIIESVPFPADDVPHHHQRS
jgi:hypothetical protein